MSNQKKRPIIIHADGIIDDRQYDSLYDAFLDHAHCCGLRSLAVRVVQFPNKFNNNTAVSCALLETNDGYIFQEVGDANPGDVPEGSKKSVIQISSEMAKEMVLSTAFNLKAQINDRVLYFDVRNEKNTNDSSFKVIEQTQQSISKQSLNCEDSNPLSAKQTEMIQSSVEKNSVDVQSHAKNRTPKK